MPLLFRPTDLPPRRRWILTAALTALTATALLQARPARA